MSFMQGVNYTVYPIGKNALHHAWKRRSRVLVSMNFIIIYLGGFLPFFGVKNFLYRILGMKIGKDTTIGLMAMFDIFYPNKISIGKNCVIGYNATILAHDITV